MAHGYTEYERATKATRQFKCGTFTANMASAGVVQSITGVGFKPSGVIFHAAQDNTAAVASWGYSGDLSDAHIRATQTTTGAYAPNTFSDSAIDVRQSGNNFYYGAVRSYDDDGFTIVWDDYQSPSGTLNINYLAYA